MNKSLSSSERIWWWLDLTTNHELKGRKYICTYTHGCGCSHHRHFFFFEIRFKGGQRKEYFHLPRQAGISRNKSTAQNTPTLMRVRYKIHSLKKFICVILIFCSFLRMEYKISWTTQNPWASSDLLNFYVSMIIIKKIQQDNITSGCGAHFRSMEKHGGPLHLIRTATKDNYFHIYNAWSQYC
jgi:hypothetical protein